MEHIIVGSYIPSSDSYPWTIGNLIVHYPFGHGNLAKMDVHIVSAHHRTSASHLCISFTLPMHAIFQQIRRATTRNEFPVITTSTSTHGVHQTFMLILHLLRACNYNVKLWMCGNLWNRMHAKWYRIVYEVQSSGRYFVKLFIKFCYQVCITLEQCFLKNF